MSSLTGPQEAALGYRGALDLANKNGYGVDSLETQKLTELWNLYVAHHGDANMSHWYNSTEGWASQNIDAAAAFIQGMVWFAQNTTGLHGTNEAVLETTFNHYARWHGDWNLASLLQQRLDPAAYNAIRDQPWWRW